MNTITNLNTFPIGNSLDGVNIITEEINTLSLLVDGTNSMLADLNMNNHSIKNVDAGVDSLDAVNKSQLDTKANTSYVDAQLALKANTSYVDTQLALKANTSYVDTQLALKANTTYVNTQISSLSNALTQDINDLENYVDTQDNLKVNKAGDTMTGVLNLNEATNSRNVVIMPKQEYYPKGGGGNITRYNYIRFNFNRADGGTANGRQWCISPENDDGTINTNALILRCGSGGFDDTRIIFGHTSNYFSQKVGIGTTTASQLLDVSGNAIVRGFLDMSMNKVNNVANGTNPNDAVNFSQLQDLRTHTDSSLNLKVNRAGDTMTGELMVNFSNASLDIRATNENEDATLYLSTPNPNPNQSEFPRRKTAIVAEGINNWSRANLHFCLNQELLQNSVVSVSDSRMCILNGGNVGIGTTEPTAKLDVNGSAIIKGSLDMSGSLNVNNTLNITKDAFSISNYSTGGPYGISLKSGNTIYDGYTFTADTLVDVPYIGSSDTTMVNRAIDFKTNNYLIFTGSNINVNGVNYTGTATATLLGPFTFVGTSIIGYYTTRTGLVDADQLTIKSNMGTQTTTEFTGIKFLNTATDAGFIRVETDKPHNNSVMSFKVRQNNSIITPLDINSTINAYKPIIRNDWSSGELIQTKIYNQNTSTNITGTSSITVGSGSTSTWKTITFNFINNPSDSILYIEAFAPYVVDGLGADEVYVIIQDTTSTTQEIMKSGQKWRGEVGGGTRGGVILPVMAAYTPSYSTSTKSRTIKINFQNSADDNLYICRLPNTSGENSTNTNYFTIKISEYKI